VPWCRIDRKNTMALLSTLGVMITARRYAISLWQGDEK
jgi:hypothetical protein